MMKTPGFDTYEPWSGEQRPLYLAPMAGVSDLPYRLLAKECGADITITEFTNSTALSREKQLRRGEKWNPTQENSRSFLKSLEVKWMTWSQQRPCSKNLLM